MVTYLQTVLRVNLITTKSMSEIKI